MKRRMIEASRIGKLLVTFSATAGLAACLIGVAARAQTAGRGAAPAPARGAATAAPAKPDATLVQLMRGVLYPASNVIFAAQGDITKFPTPDDPSSSVNPLTSTYGGWDAVQNASLALAEASRLILIPGRVCSNGRPVPVQRADFRKYAAGLRQAALRTYKTAQMKSSDAMVDAASDMSDACAACHDVYRDKPGGEKDRCLP
jgi:hypothetical protein